jgi:FKBP-type peptidyl-prolyl cis-trans isomerase FklB
MNLSARLALVAMLLCVAGCKTEVKEQAGNTVAEPAKIEAAPVEKTEPAPAEVKPAEVKAAEPVAAPAEPKETEAEKMAKISYAIGYFNGSSFKQQSLDITVDSFVSGMKDAVGGATPTMSEEEMRKMLTAFGQEMRVKMMEKAKVEGEANKKKGAEFLAANETKDGVKKTASGLQYKVVTEGTGAIPKAEDTVKVHYKGTLINGTEFDSSYKRGEPIEFPVGGVIRGWTEALQLMKVGSKWQLFIPADLAYGENAPPTIGANQVLIFDVELLDIMKPEAASQPTIEVVPAEPAKETGTK